MTFVVMPTFAVNNGTSNDTYTIDKYSKIIHTGCLEVVLGQAVTETYEV